MEEKQNPKGAQTVDRALSILEHFTFESPSHSLTEMSELTGLTVSTTHRLLRALEVHDYVVLDRETHRYGLGFAALRLAGIILDRTDLQTVAMPHLRRMRDETGETVAIHWLVDLVRVPIVEFESPHPMRMTSGIGRRYPLHSGAAGKAILAHLREEEVAQVIGRADELGSWPIARRSESELRADLDRVRTTGYAISGGEVVLGAAALACPIKEPGGHSVAAINITGPVDRWTVSRMVDYSSTLIGAAASIEAQLGYRKPAAGRLEDV